MNFEFTEEQKEFRKEVRRVLAEQWDLMRKQGVKRDVFPQDYYDALAERGWLALGFPKEYTGEESPPWKQHIFFDELNIGAPEPIFTAAYSLPFIAKILPFCTEELRRTIAPGAISGKLKFCFGGSEPDCGSDLAGMTTQAVRTGNHYVVNGTKIWNDAYQYEYMLLEARTDLTARRERGISLFMVDLGSPGIAISPIWLFYGFRRNECNFEDVKVPVENLIGEENQGWSYIRGVLKETEWSVYGVIESQKTFEMLLQYVKDAKYEGKPLKEYPGVRYRLADLALDIQVGWLISNYVRWKEEKGLPFSWEPAMTKLYCSELFQRVCEAMIDIAGQYGQLERSPAAREWLVMQGRASTYYKYSQSATIMGFTSEMQRNDIALLGLGLPGLEYWSGKSYGP